MKKNINNNLEKKEIFGTVIKYNFLGLVDSWSFFNALPLQYQNFFLQENFDLSKYLQSKSNIFNCEKYFLFDTYIHEEDFDFIVKKNHSKLLFLKFWSEYNIYQKMKIKFSKNHWSLLQNRLSYSIDSEITKEIEMSRKIIDFIEDILKDYWLEEEKVLKESYKELYKDSDRQEENSKEFLKLKKIALKIFETNRYLFDDNYVNIRRKKKIKELKSEISELQIQINLENTAIFAKQNLEEIKKSNYINKETSKILSVSNRWTRCIAISTIVFNLLALVSTLIIKYI